MLDSNEIKALFSGGALADITMPAELTDVDTPARLADIQTPARQELSRLVHSCGQVNRSLWDLEDKARMKSEEPYMTQIKRSIDRRNQQRNNIIHEMDTLIGQTLLNGRPATGRFCAESPGMIIDRLAILHIKHTMLDRLLELIEEEDLKTEYTRKQSSIAEQIADLGQFLDLYLKELAERKAFFKLYGPSKLYNDERIQAYIQRDLDPASPEPSLETRKQ